MGERIDMSLDEIIKMDKTGRKGGRGKGRGGRGGGGGGQKLSNQSYGIRKNVGGGAMRLRTRKSQFGRGPRMSDKWEHDMFESGIRTRTGGAAGGQTHLLVSNLEYGVSDADIEELFLEFGPLRKASIHYDKSGRSLGTADVVYERRTDSLKAVNQYNGVPLDGRPMKIQMVSGSPGGGRSESQIKQRFGGGGVGGGRSNRRGQGFRRGAGGGNRGNRGGGKQQPTAEELDAELDAYVNKMDVN